ncbi:hypothetical protein C3941_11620 [Kaistia algarum]|uniref:hypothetical protein n=1 Tax=Kaistia algarum TaxID=2083279 RepID=UPI000CE920F8|nr:hypothetical protein [Kaistia algarum]MCX5514995.1 hypothetical protein [Kaistia algarum]PPE79736.1 hypothetical protein C3941_11620 [Kaistia algarum]
MTGLAATTHALLAAATDQATMMMVHRWSLRIAAHFARLRAEAGSVMPVYLAYSLGHDDEPIPEGCDPDIVIRPSDASAVLPNRVAYAERFGNWTGSADRFSFPAMMGPLRGFDHIWFLEYDVDYSGDWSEFFRRAQNMPGDYLATHVRARSEDPNWPHWQSFDPPATIDAGAQLASFHPIARFSRRFRDAHVDAVERHGWSGHTEALYPSVAAHRGLSVVDLGGSGRFVPKGWAGRHYEAARDVTVLSTSFGYRPPFSFQYFHEAPEAFPDLGRLHHPIKEVDAAGAPDLFMDIGAPSEADDEPTAPADFPQGPVVQLPSWDVQEQQAIEAPAPVAPAALSVPQKIRREIRRLGRQFGAIRD